MIADLTQKLRSRIIGLFLDRVDARLYACVRITFAAVSLLNLIDLWPDRAMLFSDAGMIEQDRVREYSIDTYLSVFQFCHDASSVTAYLMISGIAMLTLMLGIMPRVSACVVFLWYVSYASRAPLALTGWDHILRSLSFLVLVSPLPAIWSLSFKRRVKTTMPARQVPCYGLTLMRMQLAVIYWQAVLARLDNTYWMNGEFLSFYLLSHNSRWPGLWVFEFGLLLKLATWLLMLSEFVIPLLLMNRRWHRLGFLLGFVLHGGIFVTSINLGMFFLAMVPLYASYLRQDDLDWLTRRLRIGGKASFT